MTSLKSHSSLLSKKNKSILMYLIRLKSDFIITLYYDNKMKTKISAMFLEIRPLAALTPPFHIFFYTETIERGANALGMSIPPPATTVCKIKSEDRDRSPIRHFL